MNFDDLHDPDPPRAGADTLAAVAGRAKQIRRRRAVMVTAGGLLAAAAVAIPAALVVTGDDSRERLAPATVPITEPPPTTGPATTPSTTTPPVAVPPALVAVRTDGDAVYIPPDGTETVLYDGADPSDQPVEGDVSVVDSIVVTPDGRRAWVTTCCEPVPGTWEEISVSTGAAVNSGNGHGFDLQPAGDLLVDVSYSALEVRDLAGAVVASYSFQNVADNARDPYSAAWIDDETIAVIERVGNEFRLLTTNEALNGYETAAGTVIGTGIEGPWPVLAGVTPSGSILVFQGTGDPASATTLQAYDPATLQRDPADDVAPPAPAMQAWMANSVLTWIGTDLVLHVGETVVPGEYLWARPA